MNLTELQNYVWTQTDTTVADLPGETIAAYLDEAFTRTVAAENRWPTYEMQWEVIVLAGAQSAAMPTDMNAPAIMSLTIDGSKLEQISQEEAESRYSTKIVTGNGGYVHYSVWASRLWLWPMRSATADRTMIVRGYRKPLQTFDPETGQVDADPRLHRALAHYAIALAYAQQEDDVLENRSMERWQRDVEMVRKALMDPPMNRPIVMYGNWRNRRGVPNSNVLDGGGGAGGGTSIIITPPS